MSDNMTYQQFRIMTSQMSNFSWWGGDCPLKVNLIVGCDGKWNYLQDFDAANMAGTESVQLVNQVLNGNYKMIMYQPYINVYNENMTE